ncbi:MAG: polysaccharide pyruvyl transferase family protein [Alphaproteobacteria bacterium]|nr:polysaccharide pyruvyl transferase family protein [Alphaproteobacteria bacterium]
MRGVLVGGGGAFLSDTNANAISGWQWAISKEQVGQLRVPLALFALGYNRFRGQAPFDARFADNVAAIVEKAFFAGLRNRGSIAALRSYLPENLAAKLVYQPCPTTVLSFLRLGAAARTTARQPVLALNAAFDRSALRFGASRQRTLRGLAMVAKAAGDDGWSIKVLCHQLDDAQITPALREAGVQFSLTHLAGQSAHRTIAAYRAVDLAIGIRGHAQTIAFGLGVPIISVVTHNKLQWFLDDIGHPDWGVETREEDFPDRLMAAYRAAAAALPERRAQVAAAREKLWVITQQNVATVRHAFRLN